MPTQRPFLFGKFYNNKHGARIRSESGEHTTNKKKTWGRSGSRVFHQIFQHPLNFPKGILGGGCCMAAANLQDPWKLPSILLALS